MNKSTSLIKQPWIFCTTILLTKLFFVMVTIHHCLIMKLEKYWLREMRYSNSIELMENLQPITSGCKPISSLTEKVLL